MAKTILLTLRANRLTATVTGDLAQGETVSAVLTAVDYTPTDGDCVLRLTKDGESLASGTVTFADGTGTGSIDLDTEAIDALFTDDATQSVAVYLVCWNAATKHLLCATRCNLARNDAK